MRKIYRDFTDKEEVERLVGYETKCQMKHRHGHLQNDFCRKIISKLQEDFTFEVNPESFYSIEVKQDGHPWHIDTGTSNHMPWCQVGISIVIKESESGGDTWYADDKEGNNKTVVDRGLYDMIAHTSDQWHMVEPHKGSRTVFLMFI